MWEPHPRHRPLATEEAHTGAVVTVMRKPLGATAAEMARIWVPGTAGRGAGQGADGAAEPSGRGGEKGVVGAAEDRSFLSLGPPATRQLSPSPPQKQGANLGQNQTGNPQNQGQQRQRGLVLVSQP